MVATTPKDQDKYPTLQSDAPQQLVASSGRILAVKGDIARFPEGTGALVMTLS